MRQTFYTNGGSGPYPGSHNLPQSDMAGVYGGNGYHTANRFRPSTQGTDQNKRQSFASDGLSDGDILSKIDSISNEELRERLIVAEMIMKKLYARNKDLETAVGKAQTKIKEVKRHTTQNFFRNTMSNNFENQNNQNNISHDPNIEQVDETNDDEEVSQGSASDIEIGCKECDKLRDKQKLLNQELDAKIKHIHELERKIDDEKFGIDNSTYNQYLQKRLKDTLEETNRHFENYVQVRNTYHELLEQKAMKKRAKKVANDSDLLALKKSLKKGITAHKDEVKKIHHLYNEYDRFHTPIEKQLVGQSNQIKRLEGELSRKTAMADKK